MSPKKKKNYKIKKRKKIFTGIKLKVAFRSFSLDFPACYLSKVLYTYVKYKLLQRYFLVKLEVVKKNYTQKVLVTEKTYLSNL